MQRLMWKQISITRHLFHPSVCLLFEVMQVPLGDDVVLVQVRRQGLQAAAVIRSADLQGTWPGIHGEGTHHGMEKGEGLLRERRNGWPALGGRCGALLPRSSPRSGVSERQAHCASVSE
eukprot:scaffold1282_cov251-Pinguiococcus_pyrenoidosus.AAC.26